LRKDNAPAFLISEAVRGAGATMLDHKGRRFVTRFHQDGELATRDVVSRAIHSVMAEYELPNVFLDLRPIGADLIAHKFPNIVKTCAAYGIDVLNEPVPIAPAAHYMMGGIQANVDGKTSVKGLYAIGECACTGLHGANRLASNSLLEAGVMALNLSDLLSTGEPDQNCSGPDLSAAAGHDRFQNGAVILPADLQNFRSMMYRYAGLVRSEHGLSTLLNTPCYMSTANLSPEHLAARNIFQVGLLIAQSARMRKESRGAHLREEYGSIDDNNFGRHLWISKDDFGWEESGQDALSLSRF
jgi:L-aspartate oxidase